tara:strand:+ start:1055 stop:1186 length:132 start_codon:yes stop_codon:yes gene_type:complete
MGGRSRRLRNAARRGGGPVDAPKVVAPKVVVPKKKKVAKKKPK